MYCCCCGCCCSCIYKKTVFERKKFVSPSTQFNFIKKAKLPGRMLANVSSAATALDPSIVRSRSRPALLDSVIIPWYSNLYIIAICLYSIWILAGLLFYYFVNDWGWATSFYFALQGGLSVGFCAPVHKL